jgi:GntR family transcriptional repressor for pyruvate dehydrogenase complex
MTSFFPVKTPKITELIINQIRNAILDGTTRPGDRLPAERELVKRFNASRIAVREALKALEASGLVTIRAGAGVFVANTGSAKMSESLYSILRIQNTSLNEVTEARLIFEPHVARLAGERIAEEDLTRLRNNIERTVAVVKSGAPATALNIEFHTLLAESTHNTVIAMTMKTMLEVAREMTSVTKETLAQRTKVSRYSVSDHKKILKALDEKNPQRVYELMYEHVVRIQRDLKKAMSKPR